MESSQTRQGKIRGARYQPERRELCATVRWSLESADARDEIRETLECKRYATAIPRHKEFTTTITWSLESSDAREEVREIYKSRKHKPFSSPSHLCHHLDYLPPPELKFLYGYGNLPSESLRHYISRPPQSRERQSSSSRLEETEETSEVDKTKVRYVLPPGPYSSSEPEQSLQALVGQAIMSSETGALTLREIYEWISTVYPYYVIPTEKDQNGRYEATWMKRLWRMLSSSYFETIPRDKECGRPFNLYRIRSEDFPCFVGGGFIRRETTGGKKRKKREPTGGKVDGGQVKTRKRQKKVKDATPDEMDDVSPSVEDDRLEDDYRFVDTDRDTSGEEDELTGFENIPFPPAPTVEPRYATRPIHPIPAPRLISQLAPTHRYHLSAPPLRSSFTAPASFSPHIPLKRLGPVHSWHEPVAFRTIPIPGSGS